MEPLDLILGACAVILILVMLWIIIWNCEIGKELRTTICALLLFLFTWLFSTILSKYNQSKIPSALDVYRGKTELQITYRDTIPVDTVVVFKKLYE